MLCALAVPWRILVLEKNVHSEIFSLDIQDVTHDKITLSLNYHHVHMSKKKKKKKEIFWTRIVNKKKLNMLCAVGKMMQGTLLSKNHVKVNTVNKIILD